jgi:hypothetical protein
MDTLDLYIYYMTTLILVLENSMSYLLINAIAFLHMYKCLIITLYPPNIYVLELSHVSMKCTQGTAVKLFAGML